MKLTSFPCLWQKNESYKRAEWAQNAVAQEFREAMYAHALYRHPLFLRSIETKGRKVCDPQTCKKQEGKASCLITQLHAMENKYGDAKIFAYLFHCPI